MVRMLVLGYVVENLVMFWVWLIVVEEADVGV